MGEILVWWSQNCRSQSSSIFLYLCPLLSSFPSLQKLRQKFSVQLAVVISRQRQEGISKEMYTDVHITQIFSSYPKIYVTDWLNRAAQTNSFGKTSLLLTRLLGKHWEISLNLQLLFLSCEFLYKRKLSRLMLSDLWLWVRSDLRTCTTSDSCVLFLTCLLCATHHNHITEYANRTMQNPKTLLHENLTVLLYTSVHPW